jgi:hypothetical protein
METHHKQEEKENDGFAVFFPLFHYSADHSAILPKIAKPESKCPDKQLPYLRITLTRIPFPGKPDLPEKIHRRLFPRKPDLPDTMHQILFE